MTHNMQQVLGAAVGRRDGFRDDGAVVVDSQDWDWRDSGVGIEESFEHRVLICEE